MNKKVAVTSYGRNKNHDDEIKKKNQEKANNSLSYRCAAINNKVQELASKIELYRFIPISNTDSVDSRLFYCGKQTQTSGKHIMQNVEQDVK